MITLTDDPGLVAGAVFAQLLPWLLFSLLSGAYVDRLDRRKLVIVVDLLRAAVIGGLAASVTAGVASVWMVYAALFLLGTAETLADNASTALLPAIVPSESLPRANARLMAVQIVGNQLAAPPFGAYLFVVAAAAPFWFDAATFLVAAAMVAAMRTTRPTRVVPSSASTTLRHDIAEGVTFLWRHRGLRLIAVLLCLMNVTFFGVYATWALYARERLGLGAVGFGVLLTASAVGGVAGSAVVARLQRRFGSAGLLRAGMVIETSTHLSLALTRHPWVAGATMVLFGAHAAVLGVVSLSLRQRLTPDRLLGRVTSAYLLLSGGGAAVGALLGGVIARSFGITAPYWVALVGMVALTAAVWRLLVPAAFDEAPGRRA